jgi:hypothetical protein
MSSTDCPARIQPEGALRVSDTHRIIFGLGLVLQILGYRKKGFINDTSVQTPKNSLAIFATQGE